MEIPRGETPRRRGTRSFRTYNTTKAIGNSDVFERAARSAKFLLV